MHYSATQSQGHVEELIGGQSWGGLKVLQLSIPENDCWLISCLNRWIFNFKFVLRQTRYWNGPAHFVALHLKHVPRTNLQKCRRSNTSLCHFQSPLVRDMPKVKFWCPMVYIYICIYCMYLLIEFVYPLAQPDFSQGIGPSTYMFPCQRCPAARKWFSSPIVWRKHTPIGYLSQKKVWRQMVQQRRYSMYGILTYFWALFGGKCR